MKKLYSHPQALIKCGVVEVGRKYYMSMPDESADYNSRDKNLANHYNSKIRGVYLKPTIKNVY